MARKSKTARKPTDAAVIEAARIEAEAEDADRTLAAQHVAAMADQPEPDTERTDAEIAAEMSEDEETETTDARRNSIVPPKYKAQYGKKEHCGDDLGYAVSGFVRDGKGAIIFEALATLAQDNGIDLVRWSHLNPGQQSMNLRNVLRGRVKRGETVQVAGTVFGPVPMAEADLGL